jgi:hypothetical protein
MTEGLSNLDEYKSASENIRWYSNMRFAQMTVFMAVTAAILSKVFSLGTGLPAFVGPALKIGGILSALIFGYMEIRADDYWSHYMKRAVELEDGLGFKQYSTRPIRKLRTTLTVRIFYLAIIVFWTLSLFYS